MQKAQQDAEASLGANGFELSAVLLQIILLEGNCQLIHTLVTVPAQCARVHDDVPVVGRTVKLPLGFLLVGDAGVGEAGEGSMTERCRRRGRRAIHADTKSAERVDKKSDKNCGGVSAKKFAG